MISNDGNEYTLTLNKRTRLRIGNCYRVYFQKDGRDKDLFSELLIMDQFLGLEDLGEFD